MGYSGVALISEMAAYYNPGALGFYYSDHQLNSFSSLSSNVNTGWPNPRLPGISSGTSASLGPYQSYRSFEYRLFGVGLGVYTRENWHTDWQVTIAAAYCGVATNIPHAWLVRTDNYLDDFYLGQELAERSPGSTNEQIDMFSAAIALEGDFHIGLGGTLKVIRWDYSGQQMTRWYYRNERDHPSAAIDLGLMVSRSWDVGHGIGNRQNTLTPTIGLSAFNIGGDESLPASGYLLRSEVDLGTSILWEMKNQHQTDFSVLMTFELSDHWSGSARQSTTGRPDTQQNRSGQIFGGYYDYPYYGGEKSETRFGSELGILEAIYLRLGLYGNDLQNHGFGIRSTGLLEILKVQGGVLGWIDSNLDISYDYAHVDEHVSTGRGHHQLSISLR